MFGLVELQGQGESWICQKILILSFIKSKNYDFDLQKRYSLENIEKGRNNSQNNNGSKNNNGNNNPGHFPCT